jgi:RimJ/RimL family protein N-acetyltransferase
MISLPLTGWSGCAWWTCQTAVVSLRRLQVSGLGYLGLATTLLQDARTADPVAGIWEAADLQWWWRRDQHPEEADQTFWLDGDVIVGAVIFTDWGDNVGCDLVRSNHGRCDPATVLWAHALERAEAHAGRPIEITVGDDDPDLIAAVTKSGFDATGEVAVTSWMSAAERAPVPPLPAGLALTARSDAPDRPHPMIRRNGEHVAERLRECSLYRPDLDLAVYASDGEVAGYGLFWADPVTGVGLVEPMRTEDRYMGMGIAGHLLAEGLDRLATVGCSRLKVTHIVGNEAAERLYLGAGFHPQSSSRSYRRARVA